MDPEPPRAPSDPPERKPAVPRALARLAKGAAGRRLLLAAQALVAVTLLTGLVLFVDWHTLAREVAATDPKAVAGSALAVVAVLLVGAFDLWILLRALAPLSYAATLRVYVVAWGSFLALPGSAGDAVQILLLRRADVPYRHGAGVYLTDKLVTLAVNLAVVAVGGAILLRDQVRSGLLALLVAAAAGAALAIYLLARRSANRWIQRAVALVDGAVAFARRHPGRMTANAGGTAAKLVLSALAAWLLLRGVGAEISLPEVLVVHPAAALVAYLPVAFNGVGTVELAAVALYGGLGVASEDTLATYLILRGVILVVALAGLASVALTRRP